MSFFGGGAGGVKTKTYHVTAADLLNAVVLTFESAIFNYICVPDVAESFDGSLKLQYQNTDGSWGHTPSLDGIGSQLRLGSNHNFWELIANHAPPFPKIPYVCRFIVDLQASTGFVDITVSFL